MKNTTVQWFKKITLSRLCDWLNFKTKTPLWGLTSEFLRLSFIHVKQPQFIYSVQSCRINAGPRHPSYPHMNTHGSHSLLDLGLPKGVSPCLTGAWLKWGLPPWVCSTSLPAPPSITELQTAASSCHSPSLSLCLINVIVCEHHFKRLQRESTRCITVKHADGWLRDAANIKCNYRKWNHNFTTEIRKYQKKSWASLTKTSEIKFKSNVCIEGLTFCQLISHTHLVSGSAYSLWCVK